MVVSEWRLGARGRRGGLGVKRKLLGQESCDGSTGACLVKSAKSVLEVCSTHCAFTLP